MTANWEEAVAAYPEAVSVRPSEGPAFLLGGTGSVQVASAPPATGARPHEPGRSPMLWLIPAILLLLPLLLVPKLVGRK